MDFDSAPGSDYMNIPSLNLPAAGDASALADEVHVNLRMLRCCLLSQRGTFLQVGQGDLASPVCISVGEKAIANPMLWQS